MYSRSSNSLNYQVNVIDLDLFILDTQVPRVSILFCQLFEEWVAFNHNLNLELHWSVYRSRVHLSMMLEHDPYSANKIPQISYSSYQPTQAKSLCCTLDSWQRLVVLTLDMKVKVVQSAFSIRKISCAEHSLGIG